MNPIKEDAIILKYSEMLPKDFELLILSGWFDILEAALEKLQKLEVKISSIVDEDCALNVYTDKQNAKVRAIVDELRKTSMHTCEVCGAPEASKHHLRYGYTVVCKDCIKKAGEIK